MTGWSISRNVIGRGHDHHLAACHPAALGENRPALVAGGLVRERGGGAPGARLVGRSTDRRRHQHSTPSAGEPPSLFALPPTFKGETFEHPKDQARLETALGKIRAALATGDRFTLAELADRGGCSEAGASARIRDLRRLEAWQIVSERVRGGLWRYYRVLP